MYHNIELRTLATTCDNMTKYNAINVSNTHLLQHSKMYLSFSKKASQISFHMYRLTSLNIMTIFIYCSKLIIHIEILSAERCLINILNRYLNDLMSDDVIRV